MGQEVEGFFYFTQGIIHLLITQPIESVRFMAEIPPLSCNMLSQTFRKAAKGHGEYCTVKNELRVHSGGKIYRFICGDCELRFAAPGQPEVVFLIAPDATVRELRRGIAGLVDSQ